METLKAKSYQITTLIALNADDHFYYRPSDITFQVNEQVGRSLWFIGDNKGN